MLIVAKALYDYTAAIPEECSFRKGDVVLVTKTQDDGWWFGEIAGTRPTLQGLVPRYFPSNSTALTEVTSLKRCSKLENRDLGVQKCLVILRGAFMLCVCGDIMYYYHIILGWEQQYI